MMQISEKMNNKLPIRFAEREKNCLLYTSFLGSAVGSLPAVENYVAFLEKDPGRSWKDVPRMGKAMQFSDVSFTYPSAKRCV